MATEDRRTPKGTGSEQDSRDNRVEMGRAELPQALRNALAQGGVVMRIGQDNEDGFRTNGRLTVTGEQRLRDALATPLAVKKPLRDQGVTQAVVLVPLTEPTDQPRPSRLRRSRPSPSPLPHVAVVAGGDDEPTVVLQYTTVNPYWGKRQPDLQFAIALPQHVAFDAALSLQDPRVARAFVDHVALDQVGIPEDEWRTGNGTDALRPAFAAWAGQHNNTSAIYVSTTVSSSPIAPHQITTRPHQELPLVVPHEPPPPVPATRTEHVNGTDDAETTQDPVTTFIELLTSPTTLSAEEQDEDEEALRRFANHVTETLDLGTYQDDVMGIVYRIIYSEKNDDDETAVITPEDFTEVTGDMETGDLVRVLRRLNTFAASPEGQGLPDDEIEDLTIAREYITDTLRLRPEIATLPAPRRETPALPPTATAEPVAPTNGEAPKGHELAPGATVRTMGDKVIITSPRADQDGAYDVYVIQGAEDAGNTIGLQGVQTQEVQLEAGGTMLLLHATLNGKPIMYFVGPDGSTNLNFSGARAKLDRATGTAVDIPTAAAVAPTDSAALDEAVPIIHDIWGRILGADGATLEPFVPETDADRDFWGADAYVAPPDRPEFWEADPVAASVLSFVPMLRGELGYLLDRKLRTKPGYSGVKQERELRIPYHIGNAGETRIIQGLSRGHIIASLPGEHVIGIGASGSGKSESLIIPNIVLRDGNVIATATDKEIYLTTRDWAASKGDVYLFDPYGVTGEEGQRWNPLQHCTTWEGARQFAHDLIVGMQSSQGSPNGDNEYWYKEAEGLLAPLLYVNAHTTRSMDTVNLTIKQLTSTKENSHLNRAIRWLNWKQIQMRRLIAEEKNKDIRRAAGTGTEQADQAFITDCQRTAKDLFSAYSILGPFRDNLEKNVGGDNAHSSLTFARQAMSPWDDHEIQEATSGNEINADRMWGNDDPYNNPSLYPVAPSDKQNLLRGVFAAMMGAHFRAAVKHNQRRDLEKIRSKKERRAEWERIKKMPKGPEKKAARKEYKRYVPPKDKPPVLMAIDEAANIAPITELDGKLSLARKDGVQFLIVFQTESQIEGVYGPSKRSTIVAGANGGLLFLWNGKDWDAHGRVSQGMGQIPVMEKRISTATSKASTTVTNSEGGRSKTRTPKGKTTTISEERVMHDILPIADINRLPRHTAISIREGYPTRLGLISAFRHPVMRLRCAIRGEVPTGLRQKTKREEITLPPGTEVAIAHQPQKATTQPPQTSRPAITSSGGELLEIVHEGEEPQMDTPQAIDKLEREHAASIEQANSKGTALEQAMQALAAGQTLPQALPTKPGTAK